MQYLGTLPQEVTDSNSKIMLHLLWETPPNSTGGLATASFELATALNDIPHQKVEIISPQQPQTPFISPFKGSPLTHYQVPVHVKKNNNDLDIIYGNPTEIENSLTELELSTANPSSDTEENLKQNPVTSFSAAVRKCHTTKYSSIHAHDWMTASAAVVARNSHLPNKPPLILHLHSTQIERHGPQSRGALYQHELWAMLQADSIITVSEQSKKIISRYYSIPADKIHVAHNASEPPASATKRPKKTHKTILFAARLVDQKSPELALEIICRVLRENQSTKAIIAGSGEKLASIRALVKFKKLQDRIEVIGHVPHEKMHIVYASSDILILPSDQEPFGLVALEAAYAGVAVVMSDQCGAAEILTSSPALSIQEIDLWTETVSHLIQSDTARSALISQQLMEVENTRWEKTAARVETIVSQLHQKKSLPTKK